MTINQMTDKIFPAFISAVSIVTCVALLLRMMRQPETDPVFADREAAGEDADAAHGLWTTLTWFAGLLVLAGLFGFIIALAVFLTTFLRIRAGLGWAKTVIFSGLGLGLMLAATGAQTTVNIRAVNTAARYFMPWQTHPTMAVTGAQCLASCVLAPGTVADGLLDRPDQSPVNVIIEHPIGAIEVIVDFDLTGGKLVVNSAGLIRTGRKLAAGELFVPARIWTGANR